MTPDETKTYLLQYADLESKIARKLEERCRLWALATKVTPAMGSNVSGGIPDPVGSFGTRLAILEREIDECIDRKAAITAAIEALPEERHRRILTEVYVNGRTLVEVSVVMKYSYRWAKEHHRQALFEITEKVCPGLPRIAP